MCSHTYRPDDAVCVERGSAEALGRGVVELLGDASGRRAMAAQRELDERQAAFMKARGFSWCAQRRSWVTGDVSRASRSV